MTRIKCFLIEKTDDRYSELVLIEPGDCVEAGRYHSARVEIGFMGKDAAMPERSDPRWPKCCDRCKKEFGPESRRSMSMEVNFWRRVDTGEVKKLNEFPAGAMWYADWMGKFYNGPDGHVLIVRTPGGEWNVDSRASNCTMKTDDTHKCWVRHGTAPEITVDKNGHTCAAGAGSILCGDYHGFLRNGYLEQC